MQTIKTRYEWSIYGNYFGHGYGTARTLEAARKAGKARARKIARENGCAGNPPSVRIYCKVYTVTYDVKMEVVS